MSQPLPNGAVLRGRYRIERLIAGGGMAWVYQVREATRDADPNRVWALKELRPDDDDAHSIAEARHLFEQEAHILVQLAHPYLPKVKAYFVEGQRAYLVMEFVHGQSLGEILEQTGGPILARRVLGWALQICDVLDYLHSRPTPVIFRDVKPSNIMLTPGGQIKLIDFGIARTYKVGQPQDTINMGSENYAAPEQWGEGQSDARTDVYGLGATVYHLLTDEQPLPAFVPQEQLPVSARNRSVSEELSAVVTRAMAKDRAQRYPSANAMREALLNCLSPFDPLRMRHRVRIDPRAASQETPSRETPPSETPAAKPPSSVKQPAIRPAASPSARQGPRCPICGQANRARANYCCRCGASLSDRLSYALELYPASGQPVRFALRDGTTLIGRPGGHYPVGLDLSTWDTEGYISRNQARLRIEGSRCTLTDLGSANGTYLNQRRLPTHQPYILRPGDRIRMGRLRFRLSISSNDHR